MSAQTLIEPALPAVRAQQRLNFVFDDGGRAEAGFRGSAGDCVARAVAIASQRPYCEVYKRLASETGQQRRRPGKLARAASAREGIETRRAWFERFMHEIGFRWVPTMSIGSGCRVHLLRGELPMGRLVVAVSKHYVAVIDGVIHDTSDVGAPREFFSHDGRRSTTWRCVYGYWTPEPHR